MPDDSGACCENEGTCGCFFVECLPGEAGDAVLPFLALTSPGASCTTSRLATAGVAASPAAKPPAPAPTPAAGQPVAAAAKP